MCTCNDSVFVSTLARKYNRKFFAPNNKSIVDFNKIFGWKNCLWIILSSLIHGCLIRSEDVLTSTINLHVSVVT